MSFFNKLNDLAKIISDQTNDAIENTKLASKVNTEKNLAGEELKKIGQFYYEKYIENGEIAEEVLEYCLAAKEHFDAAAEAQAEIDRIKAENEAAAAAKAAEAEAARAASAAAPQGLTCVCGAVNPEGTKFCRECGTKLEPPAPPEPVGNICPSCGTVNAEGTKFCCECGTKLEVPAPAEPVKRICSCGNEVEPGVKFCPECGQKME